MFLKIILNLIFNFSIQIIFILLLNNIFKLKSLDDEKNKKIIYGVAIGYQFLLMIINAYTNIFRI